MLRLPRPHGVTCHVSLALGPRMDRSGSTDAFGHLYRGHPCKAARISGECQPRIVIDLNSCGGGVEM